MKHVYEVVLVTQIHRRVKVQALIYLEMILKYLCTVAMNEKPHCNSTRLSLLNENSYRAAKQLGFDSSTKHN